MRVALFRRASRVFAAISVSLRREPILRISSSATMSSLSRSAVQGSELRMPLLLDLGFRSLLTIDVFLVDDGTCVGGADSFLLPHVSLLVRS